MSGRFLAQFMAGIIVFTRRPSRRKLVPPICSGGHLCLPYPAASCRPGRKTEPISCPPFHIGEHPAGSRAIRQPRMAAATVVLLGAPFSVRRRLQVRSAESSRRQTQGRIQRLNIRQFFSGRATTQFDQFFARGLNARLVTADRLIKSLVGCVQSIPNFFQMLRECGHTRIKLLCRPRNFPGILGLCVLLPDEIDRS